MTIRPLTTPPDAHRLPPLPNPPRKSDLQESLHFERPASMNTLARHLDALRHDATTLVSGRGYLCRQRSDLPSCPYPDMLVSFNVDAAGISDTNGYIISEAGKPPELALEVASSSTGVWDYTGKRSIYASLGVSEFWRFDHTGGRYHDQALAGDRLTPQGDYRPIDMFTEADGVIWGYSVALRLSLCWVQRQLRFWDPHQHRYLPSPSELAGELAQAHAQLDAERQARAAERQARDEAEARAQRLEEELRRIRGQ